MKKRPLTFAVLKYMTTVDKACVADVMEALKAEYSDWKMFKPAGILEILMTGEKNDLLVEDHYEEGPDGELVIYYHAHEDGIAAINSYIK